MKSTWSSYLRNCGLIVYVIDSSAAAMLASAVTDLTSLLTSPTLRESGVPILIALNKSDTEGRLSRHAIQTITRLDDLIAFANEIPSTTFTHERNSNPATASASAALPANGANGKGKPRAISVCETSAKDGVGIMELLDAIVRGLFSRTSS
jgi:signal recognition particle receptor subunit beta